MQRHKQLTRTTTLHRAGPRVKAWDRVRRQLKIDFARRGIVACELRYEGCWIDNALGFAHAAKRRKLTPGDLKTVVLTCAPCHDRIEVMAPDEMARIVGETIERRMK